MKLRLPFLALVVGIGVLLAPALAQNPDRVNQLADLKTIPLKLAGNPVKLWIMDDESKREEGMMFLKDSEVKENQGMIFVFPNMQDASKNGFWMHNCPMGLDIIYISKSKKVLNVGDGKPENDNTVPPGGNYFYVIEMKRGWSKRHGLKAGASVPIPSTLTTTK